MISLRKHKLSSTPTVSVDPSTSYSNCVEGTSFSCSCGSSRGWVQTRDKKIIKRMHRVHVKLDR